MPRPIQDALFRRGLAHLVRYVFREGHARVPFYYVERGYTLGYFVWAQRYRYKRGLLPPERIGALELVSGWTWSSMEDHFEERVRELRRHLHREGGARVDPDSDGGGRDLLGWIRRQRERFQEGRLDPEHRRVLESIPGWSWTPPPRQSRPDRLHEGFERLRQYVRRTGHARVPLHYWEGGFALANWADRVRGYYRERLLPVEMIRRLERLPGWAWRSPDPWREPLTALRRFVRRTGHARLDGRHREGAFPIGLWVKSRRVQYREGRLSRSRVRLLESFPGWSWDLGRRRRRTESGRRSTRGR